MVTRFSLASLNFPMSIVRRNSQRITTTANNRANQVRDQLLELGEEPDAGAAAAAHTSSTAHNHNFSQNARNGARKRNRARIRTSAVRGHGLLDASIVQSAFVLLRRRLAAAIS